MLLFLTEDFICFRSYDGEQSTILSNTETESASETDKHEKLDKCEVESFSTETASECMLYTSEFNENKDDEPTLLHLQKQIKRLEERLQKQYTEKYKFKKQAAQHDNRFQMIEMIFNPDQIDCTSEFLLIAKQKDKNFFISLSRSTVVMNSIEKIIL